MQALKLRLFDWGPSPFCMKLRSVLSYKGVPYERVPVLGPSLMELLRRSEVRKVPALDIDGRLLIDSTDIAHELERLFPMPRILPADPRLQGLSHALEDWADEALYFLGLYFQWLEPRGKPMVRKAFGATPLGIGARLFYQRRIAAQLRGQGTGRKSAGHIASDLRRELAALTGMLAGQPFLLGAQPYLCDFAVNAQLVYMSRPPGSAEILGEYPALAAYMERMKSLRAAPGQAGG
ncbi:glutathione S-transferase family protein [Paucibacter sediminis]|uniref:Glutathione S-transferase family protein n=1 Tax=Paucibacter sediminis TaxID=3019553 RepID=A0AA95NFU2_9BURK|nr:glutathione S-transferase family protein [Paucibacter sp. S2-9]WIT14262.1 glutathione S-transferase family protein [Paucibacter sp. S2-9]